MSQSTLTWLEKQLLGQGVPIENNGASTPQRSSVNFVAGVTITDNPGNDSTDIQIVFAGTLFTVDASSATPSKGKVVALKPGDTSETKIVVLTSSVASGPVGVLTQDWTVGATNVKVAIAGSTLPNSVTGLGASTDGRPHDVGYDSTGTLIYLYAPTGADIVIGHSPGDGRVTLVQRTTNVTSPSHAFDACASPWNAPGDGIHDAKPALDTLLAYIRDHVPGGGGRIKISKPLYLSAPVHLTRPGLIIESDHYRAPVTVGPGQTAAFVVDFVVDTDGNNGHDTVFRHINGQSTQLDITKLTATRVAGTFIEKGNCVIAGGGINPTVYFELTSLGFTPAGSAPAQFATAVPNDTFSDGAGQWICRAFPQAYPSGVQTVERMGNKRYVPGYNMWLFEVTALTGDNKTSGGTGTNLVFNAESATIVDNHVTYTARIAPCFIQRKAQSHTERVRMSGFQGAAIHTQAGAVEPGATIADACNDFAANYQNCGMGLFFSGSDANKCVTKACFGFGLGLLLSGTGGVGVWDRSDGGGEHSGNTAQNSTGADFRNDHGDLRTHDGNQSTVMNCHSETSVARVVVAPGSVYGGSPGTGGYDMTVSTGAIDDSDGMRNKYAIDNTLSRGLTAYLCLQNGKLTFGVKASDEATVSGLHQSTNMGGGNVVGFWSWAYAGAPLDQSWLVPGPNAKWPIGPGGAGTDLVSDFWFWAHNRMGVGLYNDDPRFIDFGTSAPSGIFCPRGSVRFNKTPAVGRALLWTTTVGGSIGTLAGTQAIALFMDDAVAATTPQSRGIMADSADTDAGTVSPKSEVRWARAEATTSANTANQVLFTIDPTDTTWSPIADNCTHVIDVTIVLNNHDNGSCKISGTFVRAGGAPTRVGTDDNFPKTQNGTTFDLNISGNTIQVRATPGVATAVGYTIFVDDKVRKA